MKSGSRDIIGSGSIVTHNGDSRVELEQSGLGFVLIFESANDSAPLVSGEADGLRLNLTFKNFDDAIGISWSSEVGSVSERKLFLSVYVQTLGEKPNQSRLIAYTFSAGENV